jgi:phosphatidylglycerol:prolipoprotein diacylglycerol transferase
VLPLIPITPDPVALQIGPVSIPWYGLGYAAAIAAGVWLTQREARFRALDPGLVVDGVLVVVLVGLLGARLYHVIDQWSFYSRDPLRIVLPPYSGLGLYGGVAGGIVGVWLYSKRRGQPFWRWGDAAVSSLLLGQAIARWGNFANQELYGPPTDLPWGIAIGCLHRVAAYPCSAFPVESTGFHPLFLYESALDLLGAVVVFWAGRRLAHVLRDGDLVSFWFIWYGNVRTLLEPFRDAYNWTFFGVPVAILLGIAAVAIGLVTIWLRHRRPGPSSAEVTEAMRFGPQAGPGAAEKEPVRASDNPTEPVGG